MKPDWMVAALFGLIASGDTVMLSLTNSRDAINVAISSQPKVWQRTFIRDAESWDELMVKLARATAVARAEGPSE